MPTATAARKILIAKYAEVVDRSIASAIVHAHETDGLICSYADPTAPAREGLTVEEAQDIAREDCSLVYVVTRGIEIEVPADPDEDDCLAAAAREFASERSGLGGWDLSPRWTDDDTRETVTLTIPAAAIA
jgi:hypothetical protein